MEESKVHHHFSNSVSELLPAKVSSAVIFRSLTLPVLLGMQSA